MYNAKTFYARSQPNSHATAHKRGTIGMQQNFILNIFKILGQPSRKVRTMQKRSMPARNPAHMQQFTHWAQLACNKISSLKYTKILGRTGRKGTYRGKPSMPACNPAHMQQFTHWAQFARNKISSLKYI